MNSPMRRMVFLLLLLAGCAPAGVYFSMTVDGITDPETATMKRYFLFPGNPGVSPDDLYYKEYAVYVHRVLRQRAFVSTSLDSADIVISLQYGIGPPKTEAYTYSIPIYGRTDAGTATITTNTYGSGGSTTTSGTIKSKPRYGVVGSQTYSGTSTSYVRHLILTALDLNAFRTDSSAKVVWSTTTISQGSSNDLRYVMPALIVGSADYIGTNTGKSIGVDVRDSDPRILNLRRTQ